MEQNVFKSIIGYAEVKQEMTRILDQLKHPDKYEALGVTEPHGLLLHGVPGVGKSTFANAFLEASERTMFVCQKDKSNGDFVNEIVKIFDEAAKAAPSIILLDDLDKFANEDENRRDASEFVTVQTCIDRVKDHQVFVVATVNNMRKLPISLTRAGRFDHVLELRSPSGEDAQNIVAHYLSKKAFVKDVDVRRIGRLLSGKSCAELESVVNQAGAYAAYEGRTQVEMKDMIKAILRLIFKSPESFREDVRTLPYIACHEAGHALVSELLEPDSVDLVTVLNHDSFAAGVTSTSRDESYLHSKQLMENRVMCVLAGKAATEITFGVVDTGVSCDLDIAFHIVERFIGKYCSYGFDKYIESGSTEVTDRRENRIAAEMECYYAKTKKLLVENKSKLDALTKCLVEEKTLLGDRVQEILKCA